ncbi:Phenylalanine-4-hydroxylase [Thalassocella blandensis]|nr:Phenylalanine-4-hydroxylase [Thalassocella blandensis]
MSKTSKYQAREPDAHGDVHYPESEHAIWRTLYVNQKTLIQNRACQEYQDGVALLKLPEQRIPQLHEVNAVLAATTGWQTEGVPALISFDKFFALLAARKFPVATFIRSVQEMEYLQEPDIFHEIFGHCPLLTHPSFAHFTQRYGQLGVEASKEDRVFLARLYWFTVEFGLLNTAQGLRIYGGGILSSPGETQYALDDERAERRPFDLIDVLRTPYRIDIMQPVYYVLESMEQLFDIADSDIMAKVNEAKKLGLFAPSFPVKEKLTG